MKYLYLLLTLIILSACKPAPKKNPDKRLAKKEVPASFDLGKSKNGRYVNTFFEFSFSYDTTLYVMGYDELIKLMDMGRDIAAGDDAQFKASLKASEVRTASLFGGFQHDPNQWLGSNPNILVVAENVERASGVRFGDDYLEKVRDLWYQHDVGISQIGTIRERRIGGQEFYRLEAKIEKFDASAFQTYYCAVIKDFALLIAISYTNEEERKSLVEIIDSFKFN